ncbi:SIMPL domain-containing protein [Idiomarina sp. HP20-50]|uniref:SIMPL domain-containing protein n=1 Tax=Idiomarina sp. HP20-50 TaxID=3070813 RepID=UPI00294AC091|nr:SIMPL domain-containing protein [Idiomarina sp. HP20-50]MDV6317073.1 SIMPL domain-containing protein [Idiomarina sp. HP20-50]
MTQSHSKSRLLLICLAFLTFAFAAVTQANERTLSISGSGSVSAVPDQMSLTFWIEERGNKLSSQKTLVDETTRRLIDDLNSEGVEDKDIRSYQLQIYPRYEQNDDGKTEQNGFVVQREVQVTLIEPDHYDAIIDMALARGVTRVGDIRFEISNQQSLYQQALINAYQQAKTKAEHLAATADLELANTLRIVEQSMSRPVMMQMAEMSSRSDKVSLPGQQTIEARVEVVFAIQNKSDSSN